MTISLFMFLLTVGAAASSLLTEAIKRAFMNISNNMVALVCSVVVGGLGTLCAYIFMGIPFSLENLVAMALMVVCIWVGSMVGYDKVMQTINQLRR